MRDTPHEVEIQTPEWFDIAATRALAYRVLSASLLPPDAARVQALRESIPVMEAVGRELRELTVSPAWDAFTDAVRSQSEEAWLTEYTSMFLAGSVPRGVPPYEASYVIAPGDFKAPTVSADVETVYRRVGVVTGGRFSGEFPDHIAIELDFIALLCDREADATTVSDAKACRSIQRAFLDEHLSRWVDRFAERVRREAPGGVCARAAEAADAFVAHDLVLLAAIDG